MFVPTEKQCQIICPQKNMLHCRTHLCGQSKKYICCVKCHIDNDTDYCFFSGEVDKDTKFMFFIVCKKSQYEGKSQSLIQKIKMFIKIGILK
jgi:hypothetical protein